MLEIAKLIYDAIGIESPKKFIVVCAIFGAIVFSGLGWLIAKGAQAKNAEIHPASAPASQTGNATTSGGQSPAVTGNGNSVTYGSPSDTSKKKPEPPK